TRKPSSVIRNPIVRRRERNSVKPICSPWCCPPRSTIRQRALGGSVGGAVVSDDGAGAAASGLNNGCVPRSVMIPVRTELPHFPLYPFLHCSIELRRAQPGGVDGRTDGKRHQARAFDKGVTGPDLAGIMGDRNHRYTSLHCEARTTRLIAAD